MRRAIRGRGRARVGVFLGAISYKKTISKL